MNDEEILGKSRANHPCCRGTAALSSSTYDSSCGVLLPRCSYYYCTILATSSTAVARPELAAAMWRMKTGYKYVVESTWRYRESQRKKNLAFSRGKIRWYITLPIDRSHQGLHFESW